MDKGDKMEEYLKLEDEFRELSNKMTKLEDFISSYEYETLTDESQSYLFIQKEAMKTYGSCLVARMKYIMANI